MIRRFKTVLGFYEPSIFHIYKMGDGILCNLKKWSTEQKIIFVHEYVHFLQDILSVQGFNNFFVIGEYVRNIKNMVRETAQFGVRIPISPNSLKHNVDQNWLAIESVMGDENDSGIITALSYSKEYLTSLVDYNDNSVIPVNVVNVNCLTTEGETDIRLGAIQIMEGMAFTIQEYLYPESGTDTPYNPYLIAKDVADMIIRGVSKNPFTMVALFDYSLQTTNPGLAFVNYLERKASEGFEAYTLTPEVVYEDLKKTSMHLPHPVGFVKYPDSYLAFAEGAKDVMKEYLDGNQVFKGIYTWYEAIINRGIEIRRDWPDLYLLLMEGGDIGDNPYFEYILKQFGTPIITDDTYNLDFATPDKVPITKGEMLYAYTMLNIYLAFLPEGRVKCPLLDYCCSGIITGNSIDSYCISKPWKYCADKNSCVYRACWNQMGFEGLKLISNDM